MSQHVQRRSLRLHSPDTESKSEEIPPAVQAISNLRCPLPPPILTNSSRNTPLQGSSASGQDKSSGSADASGVSSSHAAKAASAEKLPLPSVTVDVREIRGRPDESLKRASLESPRVRSKDSERTGGDSIWCPAPRGTSNLKQTSDVHGVAVGDQKGNSVHAHFSVEEPTRSKTRLRLGLNPGASGLTAGGAGAIVGNGSALHSATDRKSVV